MLRSWVPSLLFFFWGKRGEEGKAGERYDEDEVDLGRSLIVDDFISSLHTRAVLSEIEDFLIFFVCLYWLYCVYHFRI